MKSIFTLLGAVFALIMVVGLLQKSNSGLVIEDATGAILNPASPTDDQETLVLDPDAYSDSQATPPALYDQGRTGRTTAGRTQTQGATTHIDEWLRLHGRVAVLEAVRQGVPAGVSLALGIAQLNAGKLRLNDDFVAQVVTPLANHKTRAGSAYRQYFKYSANSQPWFDGLNKLGTYPGLDMEGIFHAYQLASYDGEAYLALQRGSRPAAATDQVVHASLAPGATRAERREHAVALGEVTDEELRRNVAYAMNRYADRTLDANQTRRSYQPATSESPAAKNRSRRQAEAMAVGESVVLDDPQAYQLLLREVLALEAGYRSWEAFVAERGDAARRAYRQRDDVMGNGGVLKVTRTK